MRKVSLKNKPVKEKIEIEPIEVCYTETGSSGEDNSDEVEEDQM